MGSTRTAVTTLRSKMAADIPAPSMRRVGRPVFWAGRECVPTGVPKSVRGLVSPQSHVADPPARGLHLPGPWLPGDGLRIQTLNLRGPHRAMRYYSSWGDVRLTP